MTNDQSGYGISTLGCAIALNYDGTVLAACSSYIDLESPFDVDVFICEDNFWYKTSSTPLASLLPIGAGNDYDSFPVKIQINAIGDIVIVSIPGKTINGVGLGLGVVYSFKKGMTDEGMEYIPLQAIYPNVPLDRIYFGESIKLNGIGDVLAVGSNNQNAPATLSIYRLIDSVWVMEDEISTPLAQSGGVFGVININADATQLITYTIPDFDPLTYSEPAFSGENTNITNLFSVSIYRYEKIGGIWSPIGSPLIVSDLVSYPQLSSNENGTTILISDSPTTAVSYEYTEGNWLTGTHFISSFEGTNPWVVVDQQILSRVAISNDGLLCAIGIPSDATYQPNYTNGTVHLFSSNN